jgi:hypothetical protein
VIYESRYWKEPLVRAASWLQKLRLEEATIERSLVRVERELFVGFYSIRKLLDTFKVSQPTRKLKFELEWAPSIGRVDYMNWHRLEELYDFERMQAECFRRRRPRTERWLAYSLRRTGPGTSGSTMSLLRMCSPHSELWVATIRGSLTWCATRRRFNGKRWMSPNKSFDTDAQGRPPYGSYSSVAGQLRR